MSCQHLVCASCAGPVDEGRCPTCRASRAHVHGTDGTALSPQLLALLAALLLLLLVVTQHLG
ncbi:MAG: hypothetical protein NVSMB13_04920 [Mycobacteriales bacterium]